MLTYEQIQSIAAILGWTCADVESSISELNDGFMRPCVEEFPMPDPDAEIEDPGIYWRLSAPGHMDCTEWSGPFETIEDAVADMLHVYAD